MSVCTVEPPYAVVVLEQPKPLRTIDYRVENHSYYADHLVTLCLGDVVSKTYLIRENLQRVCDPHCLFVHIPASGLFYGSHEIDFIPEEPEARADLLSLLLGDLCPTWAELLALYNIQTKG